MKIKENYLAWGIDVNAFPKNGNDAKQLEFLVNFAVLAPSSHNSQPWRFRIAGNSIIVEPEFRRALPASDKNNRQLFISIGCAVENIIIAAYYFGYKTSVSYNSKGNNIFDVKIECAHTNENNYETAHHLIFSIPATDFF